MMKKRIISLLLAMMMLAGMMSVSAFAADGDVEIEARSWNDDKYYAGDSFSVAVKIIPDGYAGVQIDVQTNDKVVFNGWHMEGFIGGYVEYEPGCDTLIWLNGKSDDEGSIDVTDGLTNVKNEDLDNGVLLELCFDVVEDAKEGDVGEIEITVKAASAEETWVVENATASTSVTISERPYTLGDVNEDGWVDISDAVRVALYDAGSVDLTESQLLAADVNLDGWVDISDAVRIALYDAGSIDSL